MDPPDRDFVIDLLGRLGTAFTYDDLEFEERTIDGIVVRLGSGETGVRGNRGHIFDVRIIAQVTGPQ